jgi:hypothetical protein
VCPGGGCRTTTYEYTVAVTDTTGLSSAPATLMITVLAEGAELSFGGG